MIDAAPTTDSYVGLFLSSALSNADQMAVFSLFFLFLARILPIIALSPFFGARVLPNPVKVFLAMTLMVVFLPQMLLSISHPVGFDNRLIGYMAKELAVGLMIGFLMGMPFIIVQGAGMIIDHQRGGSSLMVNDPIIQNQSSPIGLLFNYVLIYIFYLIDGPFLFIDAIQRSYEVIPPDQFINPAFFNKSSSIWGFVVSLFSEVMKIMIQLATPALIAILMTDCFLGIANRLAPQVQITFLGMSLKSLIGIAVIWLGWQALTTEFIVQARVWLDKVMDLLRIYKTG